MDRRRFLQRTTGLAGALALSACGGSDEQIGSSEAPAANPPASAPPSPAAPGPDAPTPATPAPLSGSFVTWDGGSGPSSGLWSQKLHVPWRNRGVGDWLDANQQPQGAKPYAQVAVEVAGPVPFDVTALVRRWVAGADNRGFYLLSRQDWPFVFAGRLGGSRTARPRLSVTTDRGTFAPPCVANAQWSPSSTSGRNSQQQFRVQKDLWFAIVQFDLAGVSGTVRSATLTLNCEEMRRSGTVELYEAYPPGFRVGGGSETPRQGIAASYPGDRNIEADPRVLFASDFSDLSKTKWHSGGAHAAQQVLDPQTRSTYLRASIPANELYGCGLEHNVVAGDTSGKPTRVVDELYARYYVYLEDSWGSTLETNKMPGLDARLGYWTKGGNWYPLTGNGGERASGMKRWNPTEQRWEYEGSSIRGHGGDKAGDGNPYDDLFWLGSYVYHLDQDSDFGDHVKWNSTVIAKNRWYCIEHYLKMNSIVGPYDAVGNGVANRDGVHRAWVDGVLVYERSNFRWRRHPEMGLQGFWLNWYHGGRQPAPTEMHFRMNSVVIARDYIGPRKDA